MDLNPTTETRSGTPGAIAPADGNAATAVAPASLPAGVAHSHGGDAQLLDDSPLHQDGGTTHAPELGPNNERLEDLKPKLVHALRELVRQYREEGITARRHEIRRIRQARLFWQGLQYAWWNPNDMNWHLPFEQRFSDDRALEEMPRYQFVTNFYQGFGLSFIAVFSQDVPSELTDQQLAGINALNQQLLGNQQQLGNSLAPQFQSIANNPGLSPADKAAVTAQSQGATKPTTTPLPQRAAETPAGNPLPSITFDTFVPLDHCAEALPASSKALAVDTATYANRNWTFIAFS
jgi:hypothetical protein